MRCSSILLLYSVQKLYTVCDVAMHIIMSKSTTYSLESPKDPVLPSRFFTKPDKVGVLKSVLGNNFLCSSCRFSGFVIGLYFVELVLPWQTILNLHLRAALQLCVFLCF